MVNNNPWKGLNYYVEGEILYGRNAEIYSLSQYIFNNTQTVLYGRSGIGKSSILNAGIFPKARQSGIIPIPVRLKHDGSAAYVEQIKEALKANGIRMEEVVKQVNPNWESLWEMMHRHRFVAETTGEDIVPMLVFDQFEEIFTLQKNEEEKRNFFSQLADLFNDVKPYYLVEKEESASKQQSETEVKSITSGAFKGLKLTLNIKKDGESRDSTYIDTPQYHIVFALREDFLSSLEQYAHSIPVMRNNRFGLLPINEVQAMDIIRLPRPNLVSEDVAELIIRNITGLDDFKSGGKFSIEVDAAILSLYLSRLYDKIPEGESIISRELVDTYSGHIIQDFYEDSINSNPQEGETIRESSILIIENELLTSDGRRNNVSESDLISKGVSKRELEILIDRRKLLRQFNHGNDIRIEYIHDILCGVVKGRIEHREQMRAREEQRLRQEEEKKRILEEERQKRIAIEKKAEEERKALEEKNRLAKKKNKKRIIAISAFVLLAAFVVAGVWYFKYFLPEQVHETYYADFRLDRGWPVGVGQPLTKAKRDKTPLYYKLSHKGKGSNRETDVEIMSSNSMLPASPRLDWPEVCRSDSDANGAELNRIFSNVKKIHFSSGEDNRIEKMTLSDNAGDALMIVNYFHLNDNEAWSQYISVDGQPMKIRDNEIDRVKLSWDTIGRISDQMYFTSSGVCSPIDSQTDTYGYHRDYSDDGKVRDISYLDRFGQPNSSMPWNLMRIKESGDTITILYYRNDQTDSGELKEVAGPDGYFKVQSIGNVENLFYPGSSKAVAKCTTEYDDHGNPVKQVITGKDEGLLPRIIIWKYFGDTGLLQEKQYLDAEGKPFGSGPEDVYLWTMKYDDNGKLVEEQQHSKDKKLRYSFSISTKKAGGAEITRQELFDWASATNLTTIDTINGGISSRTFYSRNKPVNRPVTFRGDNKVNAHHVVREKDGNTVVSKFFMVNEEGRVEALPTMRFPQQDFVSAFKLTERFNTDNVLEFMEIKDINGEIVSRMMYFIRNGQQNGRSVCGIYDKPVRCPEWEEEGFGYYRISYTKNFSDIYQFLQPYDEFGNESVFYGMGSYLKVRLVDLKDFTATNGQSDSYTIAYHFTQPNFDTDNNLSDLSLPYLHILDRKSVLAKLQDGDRIISLGNWRVGMPESVLAQEWQKLLTDGSKAEIKVLRPAQRALTPVQITVTGSSDESGRSEYHIFLLSNAEKAFFKKFHKI